MSLQCATITPSALCKIRAFVKSARSCETGGPMVGFVAGNRSLMITDVEGPGPKGKCSPFSVTIDGEHSQQFCDRIHQETNGTWDYVGDWHCHPGFSLRPSDDDSRAMHLLANTPGLVENPVSLIYSRGRRMYRVYEWENCERCLISVPAGFDQKWL